MFSPISFKKEPTNGMRFFFKRRGPTTVFVELPAFNPINVIFREQTVIWDVKLETKSNLWKHPTSQKNFGKSAWEGEWIFWQEAKEEKSSKQILSQFEVPDFILFASLDTKPRISECIPSWTGPFRVRDTKRDFVFEVEKLVTKERMTVHVNR